MRRAVICAGLLPLQGGYKTFFASAKHASLQCPDERKGRPRALSDSEALSALFKVTRTGMQWREVDTSVSYATVFRRIQRWAKESVILHAYQDTLRVYQKLVPTRHYCIDSSYVKNAFGRHCVGRNHTDRGRMEYCNRPVYVFTK